MRLNHNMNSLGIYKRYNKTIKDNAVSIDKISSGQKLNSAKDNPNKIAQSEQMRIQIKSIQSAKRNLQDGTSMLQAADGALGEANNVLSRLKELTVSAADGTKTQNDREIIQTEIDSLNGTLNDLANNTEFNGVKLIGNQNVWNNDFPMYQSIVTGAMVGEQLQIPMYNIAPGAIKDSNGNILENIDVVDPVNIQKAISLIDGAIEMVSSIRGTYGAMCNVFETTSDSVDENNYMIEKADSNIRDTDVAKEVVELARTQILTSTSLALMAQSNNFPKDALRILERVN